MLEEGLGGEEEGLGEIEETLLSSEGFGGFAKEAESGFVVGGEQVEFGFFEEVAGVEIAGGFASGVGSSGLEVSIGIGPSAIDASEMRADDVGRSGGRERLRGFEDGVDGLHTAMGFIALSIVESEHGELEPRFDA